MAAKPYKDVLFQRLPPELIFDIFSRLRIRDLSQCRFVCKGWNKYIYDPVFVQLHHSGRNLQDPDFLFLSSTSKLYLVDHDGSNLNTSLKARQCLLQGPANHKKLQLVGSSNGLLCLTSAGGLYSVCTYVCNPLTGDTLELPRESSLDAVDGEDDLIGLYGSTWGFAFDSTAKIYKVVRTRTYFSKSAGHYMTAVEIYSLGLDRSWRRINDIPTWLSFQPFQVFLNGALHWHTCQRDELHNSVVAFNMADENFKAFKGPPQPETFSWLKTNMCSLDDHLYMIYDTNYEFTVSTHFDTIIWVMREYGVETTWTQTYKITAETLPWGVSCLYDARLTRKMRDGSVLLHTMENQYYCNFEKQEYKSLKIDTNDGLGDNYFTDLVVHVGSLISPTSIDRCRPPSF